MLASFLGSWDHLSGKMLSGLVREKGRWEAGEEVDSSGVAWAFKGTGWAPCLESWWVGTLPWFSP